MTAAILIIVIFSGGNGMPATTSIGFRSMAACETTATRIKEVRNQNSNWNSSIIICTEDK